MSSTFQIKCKVQRPAFISQHKSFVFYLSFQTAFEINRSLKLEGKYFKYSIICPFTIAANFNAKSNVFSHTDARNLFFFYFILLCKIMVSMQYSRYINYFSSTSTVLYLSKHSKMNVNLHV